MKKLLQYSLYLNGGIWLAFSILAISGLHYGIPEDWTSRIIIALLALGAGVSLVLLRYLAVRFSNRWYYLLMTELLLIVFITVTDEFGWPDLVVLLTHLASLVFLAPEIKRAGDRSSR